jgi:hypothetical protein
LDLESNSHGRIIETHIGRRLFRWDEDRRFLLRCELDAAFFHLYLGSEDEWRQQPEALTRAFPTPRHAVSYIMDTFPIVKRKDEAKHGTYRTKETILQIYDALAKSIASGNPWLCVDAFLALRLALEADVAVAQASEKTQQTLVEQIIQFGKVA